MSAAAAPPSGGGVHVSEGSTSISGKELVAKDVRERFGQGGKNSVFNGAAAVPSKAAPSEGAAAAGGGAGASPYEGGVHFVIPEGTTSITGPDCEGRGHNSWKDWGVDKKKLMSVTIPASVTTIGGHAFQGCRSLTSLEIPSTVTTIGEYAFQGCSALTRIVIPSSDTSIDDWAFQGCVSLTNLEIPQSVVSIGENAFRRCSSLLSMDIPASVTTIRGKAFSGCSSLLSVEIPATVSTIGGPVSTTFKGGLGMFKGAFGQCTSLKVLLVQPTNTVDGGGGAAATAHPAPAAPLFDKYAAAAAATAVAAGTATTSGTSAIVKAFNEEKQFPNVTKIWATNDIIKELKGPFAAYNSFGDLPRALRAAPDAKTWAGVQLWLWWLPPTSFVGGGDGNDRVVCKSRHLTIWTTMLAAVRAEKTTTLPCLPEELWLHMFGFLKHDQQPIF